MTAIQRWWFLDTGEDYHPQGYLTQDGEKELWCKAKDVAELEQVIEQQSENYRLVTEALRGRISIKDAEIERLKEFEWIYKDLCK